MNLASEHNNASCSSDAENRLRIEIVRTIGNLESKSVAWNELALKAPQQLPMLSHAWVASYFEHRLAARESWFCIFAYDDDNLVGVLPVVIKDFFDSDHLNQEGVEKFNEKLLHELGKHNLLP